MIRNSTFVKMLDDEEELEDGEVTSGNESPTEYSSVDYEVLQRPVKCVGRPGTTSNKEDKEAGCSRTMGFWENDKACNTWAVPVIKDGDNGEYDEGEYRSNSSSSEDSDQDGPTSNKRRMPMPTSTDGAEIPWNLRNGMGAETTPGMKMEMDNNAVFKQQAEVFQQKRKTNNIWSSVLQEEEVSDIFGKVNVEEYDEQHVLIKRGPETFSVKYKTRPLVRRKSDSSSLSSGGLTDNELEFLRGIVDQECGDDRDDVKEGPSIGYVTRLGRRTLKRRYDSKKLKARKKRKGRMKRKMKMMEVGELGSYIAEKLTEPKTHLITKAIQYIGKDACITLFLKTTKIERRGGLMIRNQERRRTAGGVFFYLLRGDKKYPKKLVDKIFQDDKIDQRICRKRAHDLKRAKKFKELQKNLLSDQSKDNAMSVENVPIVQSEFQSESEESALSDTGAEAVDSDEFCRTTENNEINSVDARQVMFYEDQDCLDIYCDPTDLM